MNENPIRHILILTGSSTHLFPGFNRSELSGLEVTNANAHMKNMFRKGRIVALVLVDGFKKTDQQREWVLSARGFNLPTFTVTNLEKDTYETIINLIDRPEVLIQSCGDSIITRVCYSTENTSDDY